MLNRSRHFLLALIVLVGLSSITKADSPASEAPGSTRVAKWKDDKLSAFMLMFDDSVPTDIRNVVPELKKRNMIATFYINPGKGEWRLFPDAWEKQLPALGMEYGNHTFTHKGVRDVPDAEQEIGKCNEVILRLFPDQKNPRLVSYGQPGVKQGDWNITKEQLAVLLKEHNLVERPNMGGRFAAINLHSVDEMSKLVDTAIKTGNWEYVGFHGVGGDWLSFPLADFVQFLDKLAEHQDQLWITGHISAYKYAEERDSAAVEIVSADKDSINLKLRTKTDPNFYDAPLTLVTHVPATWTECEIKQAGAEHKVHSKDGLVRYDALPGDAAILIAPAAR